jgi:cobalt/nickel transport system permease protein
MTLAFDTLPVGDSWLSRLDPRWKLAALLLAAAAAAMLQALPAAAIGLAGTLALAASARLPRAWYLARLATVLLLVAPFALMLPLLHRQHETAWEVGPVQLSPHGTQLGALLCLKAATITSLFLILLATGPLPVTLKAAQSLRVPGLLVQLTVLTYRYLFVLADELARLRLALRVRGYRNRANLHSYRTVGHVAGTLLVRGYERAERVGQAMRCRGFNGRFRALADFQTTWLDVVVFFAITLTSAALVVWDLCGG